jgi:hypothetical protein
LNDGTFNLQKTLNSPAAILNPQSIYSFSMKQDWGLLAFLLSLSSKIAFDNFNLFANKTASNSSIVHLLKDDETSLITTDEPNSRIGIIFNNDWVFHPIGFKLKSGKHSFPRTWKVIGEDCNYHERILVEFKGVESLSLPFKEQIFPIHSNDYFQRISFEQTGANSDENNIFCLSQHEIYGELKHL